MNLIVLQDTKLCLNLEATSKEEAFLLGVAAEKLRAAGAQIAWPSNGGPVSLRIEREVKP